MTPNPGSREAVALGCVCPVIDNHYGAGVDGQWWYSEGCPVHCGAALTKVKLDVSLDLSREETVAIVSVPPHLLDVLGEQAVKDAVHRAIRDAALQAARNAFGIQIDEAGEDE